MLIRQDAVLVGRPPWAAAAGVGSCPGLAAGRSSSPGSGEPGTLGTHHHPGPADQTLNLPEPANCRIKTNTQDGCQNFRFNALPCEPVLGRWATFGWWAPLVERPGRSSFRLAAVSAISMLPRGRGSQLEATGHQLDPPDPVRHFVHHQDRYRARNQRPFRRVLCSQSGARTVSFSM